VTVDPRHLDPEPVDPEAVDPAATQSEREYPTAEYPVSDYPGAAQAAAAYRAAPRPAPSYPAAAYRAAPQPGVPQAATAHARMLAASADRERAVDVLKAGFAEGRLTQAEYNDRVGRVYASRTYGELEVLVGDLPAGPLGGPAHYQGGGYPVQPRVAPATNSLAVASLVCGLGEFFTMGLTAIPAVVLGHMARRQMRQTGERGDGMAVAGLFLGWAGIGLFIAIITGLIVAASTIQARTGNPVINGFPKGPPPGP
jgi:hypothetical protein